MNFVSNRRSTEAKHYPALDGLRGVAVLLVMLHHFVRSYEAGGAVHTFALHLTEFMWTGVDLFFVLSGFLITGILLETRGDRHYFRNFYARRILRIFPLYYGLLAVAFLLLPLVQFGPSAESNANLLYLLTFTSNIHFAFSGWSMHAFDVYWSLAVEEQFYLFWPVTLWLLPERFYKPLVIVGLAACVVLRYLAVHAGTSAIFIFTMLPTHADGLLIGALIAILLHQRNNLPEASGAVAVGVTLFIAAFFLSGTFHLLGLSLFYNEWNTRGAMFYYLAIATVYGALLYLSIGPLNPIQRMFSSRSLRLAGKYSYCLYLIHQAVAHMLNLVYANWGITAALQSKAHFISDIAHLLPLFVISFAVAAFSWRLVERPILGWKKYFTYSGAPAA